MKKLIIAAGLADAGLMPTAMPAAADAASYCPVKASDWTRGGYLVIYRGASAKGMSCSSVRYALGEFRAQVSAPGPATRVWRGRSTTAT